MNPRLRRLQSDHQGVQTAFHEHPHIALIQVEGEPPERYVFDIYANGLAPEGDDSCTPIEAHRVEVFLPMDYPRRPPVCRMLSPVFHPNIDPQKVCIGDHWNAGQSIVQLVIRVAEMICFQSYNVKSPLNAKAAAWAEENEHLLPLDESDLSGGL